MNGDKKHDLVSYRLKRARETLSEVQLHIDNELWSTAINRIYYACYYAVSALLVNRNIKAKSHSGIRHMFGLHFIKTGIVPKNLGKFYSDIFDMRHTGDYDDFVEFSKEDVSDVIEPAKDLILRIENLIGV